MGINASVFSSSNINIYKGNYYGSDGTVNNERVARTASTLQTERPRRKCCIDGWIRYQLARVAVWAFVSFLATCFVVGAPTRDNPASSIFLFGTLLTGIAVYGILIQPATIARLHAEETHVNRDESEIPDPTAPYNTRGRGKRGRGGKSQ